MIRILIADDHPLVREGLKWILGDAPGMRVCGEADNGAEVLRKLGEEQYDVVLLDISMPEIDGIAALQKIVEKSSGIKVLMLSAHPENKHAVQLMKAGASGYLMKDAAPKQLIEAIRKVASGCRYISPELAGLLLHECATDSGRPLHELLSNREYQVLQMLGSGKPVSQIAEILSLSARTVSTYRSHILEKMNIKNNAELTFYVIQNGLINITST